MEKRPSIFLACEESWNRHAPSELSAGLKCVLVGLSCALALLMGLVLPGESAESPKGIAAVSEAKEILLSDSDWKLGSFPMDQGEGQKAFLPEFDDSGFRTARIPGEVQLQLGLKGMDLFYPSKTLTLVNDQEWWHRKRFVIPQESAGKLVRLVFEGVDYFATVWLNGEKLGEHEGTFVPFSYDVSAKLRYGRENVLAVKVTSPWLPKGRGFEEYLKGSWVTYDEQLLLPSAPFILGPHWGGLPAEGNATFPMGIWRDVKLVTSGSAVVEDLFVRTKELRADGSAALDISGLVRNYGHENLSGVLKMKIAPENFKGEAAVLLPQTLSIRPGENRFRLDAVLKDAHLWWTWDLGQPNLYKLTATLSVAGGDGQEVQEALLGVRTIARDPDMAYRLNGKRFFLRGTWYPISDYYLSKPTREDFEKDVEQLRAANLNHVVAFTVVEKPDFYDFCDRLGMLVIFEFPFAQFGPLQVLSPTNPRHDIFVKESLGQLRQIITGHRNHPSIIEWAAFAEAHQKGGEWGWGEHDLEYYQPFSDAIGKLVGELDPGTIYHPSLCDIGEQHFWLAHGGMGTVGGYNEHFNANTEFVSEYGSASLPSYEAMQKALKPSDLWSHPEDSLPRWFNLPIDLSSYSYLAEFEQDGWFSNLYRVDQYVDRHIRSAAELVDDSQLYHAFLLKYPTEAYRRKKHHSINGIRNWCYKDVSPQMAASFVDYYSTPKISFYYLRNAAAPFAVNFAYEEALESQVSGKRLSIPVWVVNDHLRSMGVRVRCEIRNLAGEVLWSKEFHGQVGSDASREMGVVEWTTPYKPGIYVLSATASEDAGKEVAQNSTFIKVTPKLYGRQVNVLLIGKRSYSHPIAELVRGMGVNVTVIDESCLEKLNLLRSASEIREKYDLVWLTSLDSFWKVLGHDAGRALQEAINQGTGFIHTGGQNSFHGGHGNGSYLEFTPLAEVLPVETGGGTDLILKQPIEMTADLAQRFAPIKDIQVDAPLAGDWSDFGLKDFGVPGFNLVRLKPGNNQILSICQKPLLVTGQYGKGHAVAFTGFTPVLAERHADWDPKIVFPYLIDQEFYTNPVTRAYFLLFMRMLAEATGEKPQEDYRSLLAAREKPLFESLKDQPTAELSLPARLEAKVSGRRAKLSLNLQARGQYARLVRVRAEWDGPQEPAPYLILYGDNYFDLLPREAKTINLDVFLPSQRSQKVVGHLIVEGTNVGTRKIPIELQGE